MDITVHPALESAPSKPVLPGNRCLHDKDNPRLELANPPQRKGRLPALILDCIANLQAYYYDRSILRPLAEIDVTEKKVTAGKRSNRSEARETDVLMCSAILHCLDLTSLMVAVPVAGGKFLNRSLYELAAMAGLVDPETDEPHRRAKRFMSRFRRAGLIDVTRTTYQTKTGQTRGSYAIRKVSEDFIILLMGGTDACRQRLYKARKGHYQATKPARTRSHQTAEEQRNSLASRMISNAATKRQQAEQAAQETKTPAIDVMNPDAMRAAYNKARIQRQNVLLAANPDPKVFMEEMRKFPTFENWRP
ncbi:MAG: hypothetical protein ACRDDI_13525 [Aeromonas veronii]